MSKFKVGDIVKIKEKLEGDIHIDPNSFTVGKEYEVKDVKPDIVSILSDKDSEYYLLDSWVEHCEPKPLTRKEALHAMIDGERIQVNNTGDKESYAFFCQNRYLFKYRCEILGKSSPVGLYLEYDEYQTYKEPKKKEEPKITIELTQKQIDTLKEQGVI